ncbi:MAG: DNA ligase D, partial [Geminicoccaceae bacterium]
VGRVDTVWNARTGQVLREALDPLRVAQPPFARLPAAAQRGARWVRPELLAEVQFQTWTADGLLRHASFQGLREDKPATGIVRERPARRPAAGAGAGAPLDLHGVRISSAERQVLDRPRLTKGDVARCYAALADWILPYVAGRPLSVIRCPEQLGEGCFYQRHLAAGMPPSVRQVAGAGRDGKEPYLAIDDAEGLLALVQFGAIEFHPSGARADRPDRPDRLVFDLDPAEELPFAQVVAAAHELRQRLQRLGLSSFPRTTGGKGLHLIVPIERRHGWAEAKAFAGSLARAMQADSPDRYTASLAKAARKGRIFVDYLRNDRTATAVASYSLRGRAHAPVAMPLSWDAITPKLEPLDYTLLTVPDMVAHRPDPWAMLTRCRQRLRPDVARRLAA